MEFAKVSGSRPSHPTEKPTDLCSRLILDASDIGGIVLDPFMGSGTTGVSCASTGRNFVGIELDKDYFDIAKARIETTLQDREVGVA